MYKTSAFAHTCLAVSQTFALYTQAVSAVGAQGRLPQTPRATAYKRNAPDVIYVINLIEYDAGTRMRDPHV